MRLSIDNIWRSDFRDVGCEKKEVGCKRKRKYIVGKPHSRRPQEGPWPIGTWRWDHRGPVEGCMEPESQMTQVMSLVMP